MNRALLILLKNPVPGNVKTRIARESGDDLAIRIYHELVSHVRRVVLELDIIRYAFVDELPPLIPGFDNRQFRIRKQSGNNIGERMFHAFSVALPSHGSAILIGGDLPTLRVEILEEAFAKLEEFDLTVGPASDGGYYLIGMKRPIPELFHNIAWSTAGVLQETLEVAGNLGLTWHLLPMLPDVDTWDDWKKFGWSLD
jgi:hypothetical protein